MTSYSKLSGTYCTVNKDSKYKIDTCTTYVVGLKTNFKKLKKNNIPAKDIVTQTASLHAGSCNSEMLTLI